MWTSLAVSARPLISRRRVVGLIVVAILLALFLAFNRVPKLDTVRQDLIAVSAPTAECFQGFCIDADPSGTLWSRWWHFSITYLQLVSVGMVFAFLVAGATEAFLFPRGESRWLLSGGMKGALKGLVLGTPMTLCSACIVPVTSAFRRRGAGIEATLAMVQGSSTLNLPAMVMAVMVFTPWLAGVRVAVSLAGALLIGPLVALAIGEHRRSSAALTEPIISGAPDDDAWPDVLRDGARDWLRASFGYLLRLGPVMVIAGFASGLAIQWLDPSSVDTFLGDHAAGIVIAATLGILINVPLLFEIPLVAALLLVGMGLAPAAALLFTAAAGGPITFWGLAKVMPRRAVAGFAGSTWVLGLLAGAVLLGVGSLTTISSPLQSPEDFAAANRAAVPQRTVRPFELDESTSASRTRPAPSNLTTGVSFTDATQEAGLAYVQSTLRTMGSCLLDDDPNSSAARGTFCDPERMSGGAAAADYDGDGWVDLYVTRLDGPDILFRNRGDGTFENRSAYAGLGRFDLRSNGAAWADIDNDGDPDLYVTALADQRFYLFINDGAGRFTEEAVSRGAALASEHTHVGFSVAVGDYDRDGWLDLHTTEFRTVRMVGSGVPSHARLLRNRGAERPGHFEDVTERAGVSLDQVRSLTGIPIKGTFALASGFVDLDADGWPDLAVVSDFGHTRLFWNNGDGTFTDGTLAGEVISDENGMGSAFGDYDGDGDLDWFVSSIYDPTNMCEWQSRCAWGTSGNRLYQNEGGRQFADATTEAGVRDGAWGWGAVFLDYDNDGDLDLALVNGMVMSDLRPSSDSQAGQSAWPFERDQTRFWENDGTGRMTERAADLGLNDSDPGKGLLTFDYDRDGDLDLFAVTTAGQPHLYRNDGGSANPWLSVQVIGQTSNRDGIGARVYVLTSPDGRPQIREIGARSHYLGQSELREHFGLGPGVERVAEVRVEWPMSGAVTVLRDVPAKVHIVVREGQAGYQVESVPGR